MGQVVPINAAARVSYNHHELALIRRNYAKESTDDEFNSFIYLCRHLGLCPLKKQIYFFVFNPDRDDRAWTVVVGIVGFRTIASRTGRYRPDENDPKFRYDKRKVSDLNPLGIVSVSVRVNVQDSNGDWYPVSGTARWDEYVPTKNVWFEDDRGNWKPSGQKMLESDSMWRKMPTRMLEKVAEAHALRKAFPDELANVYEESEIDRVSTSYLDLPPSEFTSYAEAQDRLRALGGPSVQIDWMEDDGAPLDNVPVGHLADRVMDWIARHKEKPVMVGNFEGRNRAALRIFWGHNKTDAVAIKKAITAAVGGRA